MLINDIAVFRLHYRLVFKTQHPYQSSWFRSVFQNKSDGLGRTGPTHLMMVTGNRVVRRLIFCVKYGRNGVLPCVVGRRVILWFLLHHIRAPMITSNRSVAFLF